MSSIDEYNSDDMNDFPPLKTGHTVPELSDIVWLKGDSRKLGVGLTVVEFWATWCGPCLQTIPHLTELQKKYKGKLSIIGLSNEEKETVTPFVKSQGSNMDYTVGIASEELYARYMAGVEGIPHSFLVNKDKKVIWSGHPMEIDPVLSSLLEKGASEEEIMLPMLEQDEFNVAVNEAMQDNSEENKKDLYNKGAKILKRNPADIRVMQTLTYVAATSYGIDEMNRVCDTFDISAYSAEDFRAMIEQFVFSIPVDFRPYSHSAKWIKAGIKKFPKNADVLYAYCKVLTDLCFFDEAIKAAEEGLSLNPNLEELQLNMEILKRIKTARTFI